MAQLRLEGVAKRFGGVQALAPLDLTIGSGEFLGVLGPSGCGKTTLLRCLAGLETPDEGTISFGDQVVFDGTRGIQVPPQSRGIGMVFQDLALWPHLDVFENVAFTLRARKDTKDLTARVEAALEQVRLAGYGDRYPHQLSGGQQQRIAFARAVVNRPAVLFMDEPLSALDAALRIDLRAELTALTKELGLTAVYVTHDQEEAMSMSDRILVMEEGHVRQDGLPEAIYQRPSSFFVADFIGRLNLLDRPEHYLDVTRLVPAPAANGLGEVVSGGEAASADGAARTTVVAGGAGDDLGAGVAAGIRPEKVHLSPNGAHSAALEAEVELASYLGDRYELRCRVDGASTPWVVYSDRRVGIGERITLHVEPEDLIVTAR